jgi:hypothetical protein
MMVESPRPWIYAVEISNENHGLAELSRRTRQHFKERRDEHEVVLENQARIVVRFTDFDAASRFYFNEGGRFVRLLEAPTGSPDLPTKPT